MRVDPNYLRGLAAAVDQSSGVENTLTQELSSGLRVTSLQDDPGAIASSTLLGSAIARDDSFVQSASGVQSVLQVADSTLGEVVTQITSALSLAVQGSGGTQNTSNNLSIAQQLTGIRDQVLSLANTSYTGSYIFGGSNGSGPPPFSLNTTTTPATVVYVGDGNAVSIETTTGQKIQVNMPGSAIFGADSAIFGTPGAGVLTVLNKLITDFQGGTASASVVTDTSALTSALGQLSSQRSVLDSSLSRLQQTSSYTQTEEAQLTAQQGTLVSADLATVATQLKSAEMQHEAILSVMNALGSTDLFSLMR